MDSNMTQEQWKPIVGFEAYYQISNKGRIYSIQSERIINGWADNGYMRVTLSVNKKEATFKVHRLVAVHFIPNAEEKNFVNHKDCNGLNNDVRNLEWVTASENLIHAYKNNRIKRSRGVNSHMAKILVHEDYGVFATVAEVARTENKSFGQMAAIIRGEYPNKTRWALT